MRHLRESGPEAFLSFLGSSDVSRAHAGAPADLVTIETHMSRVYLAGEHVLKMKKPVRFPYLDFSTLAERGVACHDEVRLNRRLAPGVYLGVLAVQWRHGQLVLVPAEEAGEGACTVEWMVWMRRLPGDRMLDKAIAARRVTGADVDALVAVLAAFYAGAQRVDLDPAEHRARFEREQALNRDVLLRPAFRIEDAAQALDRLDRALWQGRDALHERVAQGRLVDGHGDLRSEHVCLLRPPVVIDCIEFNARLREVDPYDELAFLGLECDMAGADWIGPQLIEGCARAWNDTLPVRLLHLYTAVRALLRARLAMAHLLDAQPRTPQRWAPTARRYLERGLRALDAFERMDRFSAATRRGWP